MAPQPSLLSHPNWQGIAGIAAIIGIIVAIVLAVVYSGGNGGAPNRPTASTPESRGSITTRAVGSTRTVATTSTRQLSARDPHRGEDSVATESSKDFFGGDLVVSIGGANSDDTGELFLTRMVLRAADKGACQFWLIKTGDDPGITAGAWTYRVEVRSLTFGDAKLVASRRAAPKTHAKQCMPITTSSP